MTDERDGDDSRGRPGSGRGDGSAPGSGRRRRGRGARTGSGARDHREQRKRQRHGPRPLTPEQLEARRRAVPAITYPDQLSVSQRRDEIARAIRDHQVVVVAGETGSGKTTQLPKICLELGRGVTGTIGHTQPRRIAARTVAERIATELGVEMGGAVGYQVRFTDEAGPTTLVKLMTDGILLAEIQRDPMLSRYDTIIVDEAHERSLNIDFILGYLTELLPKRPDLKVIITSATIDAERFAEHFGAAVAHDGTAPTGGEDTPPVPVIEVTGRTYPVEIRYHPLDPAEEDDAGDPSGTEAAGGEAAPRTRRTGRSPAPVAEPLDQPTAICRAADELVAEGSGDILVFLAGEREIRDAESALADHFRRQLDARLLEILPLYARLSSAEQHRVFQPHGTRRIVLATNVAETSLTVPGIRYVIDPGTARISRFSNRTKVQRLPIEPISQASANQRAGRCGRVADGICIRLYSESDFASRPEFTEPEILRTSLASVVLQMTALGLGEVADFGFVDPPEARAVRDGVQLLTEIGAIRTGDAGLDLTEIGRQLARLPIDPRLGRMLLAARDNGCVAEVLVIVAALSIQDVRERPVAHQQRADELHRRFLDPGSDFLAYLNLWRYLRVQQRDLSGSAFRRMCRNEFLNYLRVREWQDVVAQLRQLAKPLGLTMRPLALPHREEVGGDPAAAAVAVGRSEDAASADAVHQSLLTGLLSNLGNYDERRREYAGARGTRFVVWPGSGLAKRSYDWVMAAELVETSRLFARTVARIQPDWVEPAAAHLVKAVHSEPFWSRRQGAAMVHEKVLLYGMTLVADRVVPLSRVGTEEARALARELFIRHALVEGDWRTHHEFFTRNRELLDEVGELEHRARRRDLLIDAQGLEDFYDERIPDSVTSARHFDSWWKKARRENPELLSFTRELLVPGEVDTSGFPDTWTQGDLTLPLSYAFDPGAQSDGVTVDVPISVLARLRPDGFDWLVPGLLEELVTAAIRSLPKPIRVGLVPAPDVARQIRDLLPPWQEVAPAPPGAPSFTEAFSAAARRLRDVEIPPEAWDAERLPAHLRMTFRVVGEDGAVLAEHTSVPYLQRRLAAQSQQAVRSAVKGAVAQAMAEARHRDGSRGGGAEHGGMPSGAGDGGAGDGRAGGGGMGSPAPEKTGGRGGAGMRADETPDSSRGELSGFSEQHDLRTWPDLPGGELPAQVEQRGAHGLVVRGYPALVDLSSRGRDGSGGASAKGGRGGGRASRVDLQVLTGAAEQARAHRLGLRRLVLLETALPTTRVTTRWPGADALRLAASPYPSTEALVANVQLAAATALVDEWLATEGVTLLRHASEYERLRSWVRDRLEERVHECVRYVVAALTAHAELEQTISETTSMFLLGVITEVREQVAGLVHDGFVSATPADRLVHLARYLRAATRRIERARDNVHADEANAWRVRELVAEWRAHTDQAERGGPDARRDAVLVEARWLIEELRVSLFAQQLGTPVKVSEKRIRKLMTEA